MFIGHRHLISRLAENSVQGQIETVTAATTQGVHAIMIASIVGDQIAPVAKAAVDVGDRLCHGKIKTAPLQTEPSLLYSFIGRNGL